MTTEMDLSDPEMIRKIVKVVAELVYAGMVAGYIIVARREEKVCEGFRFVFCGGEQTMKEDDV